MARGKRYGPFEYERRLGQRNYSAKTQIDDIIGKTDQRLTALVRQSVQETIDDAQTAVAKGGRMRVDTGFLRASGQLSLTGMPTGPVRGEPEQTYAPDDASVTLQLGNYKLGSTLYFGWTANYAKFREAYDGFLEGAVQKWPQTVARVTAQIKARIK